MDRLKKYSKITLFLAGLSLVALLFCYLALTDIYHGETDLHLEWIVLRIGAIIFLTFMISAILTIKQIFKVT